MPKTNTPKVEVNKETIVGRGTEKSSRGRGAMVKGYKFRGVY